MLDTVAIIAMGFIAFFLGYLTMRALTGDEVVELAGDPDIVRAVNAIADLNKREHGVG